LVQNDFINTSAVGSTNQGRQSGLIIEYGVCPALKSGVS